MLSFSLTFQSSLSLYPSDMARELKSLINIPQAQKTIRTKEDIPPGFPDLSNLYCISNIPEHMAVSTDESVQTSNLFHHFAEKLFIHCILNSLSVF